MRVINNARPFNVGDEIFAGIDQPPRRVQSWNPDAHTVTVSDTRGRAYDIRWNEARILRVQR